ncbi:hypothetical protein BMI86_16410 [Thioclava sp. DLFJ5-1]|nr:hypothetical protein [Thioclava sp.]OOY07085.1 hypothetical protein BMI89_19395 [Thioclava sp. F36-7]OOY19393.1 hypothetical protein BMI86_16410 [Thioclava sp. DLFJ5-1]
MKGKAFAATLRLSQMQPGTVEIEREPRELAGGCREVARMLVAGAKDDRTPIMRAARPLALILLA